VNDKTGDGAGRLGYTRGARWRAGAIPAA